MSRDNPLFSVLMISAHDVWGGTDTFSPLLKILQYLGDKGVKIRFVSIDKPKTIDKASMIFGEPVDFIHENVNIDRYTMPGDAWVFPVCLRLPFISPLAHRFRTEVLFPWIVYRNLKTVAAEFDIVYAYEIFGVKIAKKLAQRHKKPLVTRFQGTFILDWLRDVGNPWIRWVYFLRYRLHIQALGTKADMVVMTDDGTKGMSALEKFNNIDNVKFWRNGIDFQASDHSKAELRERLGLPQENVFTVSVCRLSKWKHIERILYSLPLVVSKYPNLIHLVVGDGEEREFLNEVCCNTNISHHVKFLGQLPHHRVSEYVQASDVFLSLFDSTNVGNPLQEALKLGKPIITYNVGDTAELIEHEKNGVLLDSIEPHIVAQSILRVLGDREFSERIGKGALETGSRLWSWEERLFAEYKELIRLAAK